MAGWVQGSSDPLSVELLRRPKVGENEPGIRIFGYVFGDKEKKRVRKERKNNMEQIFVALC